MIIRKIWLVNIVRNFCFLWWGHLFVLWPSQLVCTGTYQDKLFFRPDILKTENLLHSSLLQRYWISRHLKDSSDGSFLRLQQSFKMSGPCSYYNFRGMIGTSTICSSKNIFHQIGLPVYWSVFPVRRQTFRGQESYLAHIHMCLNSKMMGSFRTWKIFYKYWLNNE